MFTEHDLEEYNNYMNWVRQMIVEENTEIGVKIKEEHISLGHIEKIDTIGMGEEIWEFQYKLKKKRRYKTIRLKAFDEWISFVKQEERDAKIDMILEGLREDHQQMLIEGLKKINKR